MSVLDSTGPSTDPSHTDNLGTALLLYHLTAPEPLYRAIGTMAYRVGTGGTTTMRKHCWIMLYVSWALYTYVFADRSRPVGASR